MIVHLLRGSLTGLRDDVLRQEHNEAISGYGTSATSHDVRSKPTIRR